MEWLDKEIERGLAGLVIMRVPGFPPAEQMENVVRVWSGALAETRKWNEAQDVDRIREAFRQLVLLSKRWPTVSEFLEVLPMRDVAPAQTVPAAAPPYTHRCRGTAKQGCSPPENSPEHCRYTHRQGILLFR